LTRTAWVWEESASADEGELERGRGRCLQVTQRRGIGERELEQEGSGGDVGEKEASARVAN
jgi:hypothetical protein